VPQIPNHYAHLLTGNYFQDHLLNFSFSSVSSSSILSEMTY